MSDNESMIVVHLDFPLTINHANGKPAIKSIIDTMKAIAKDHRIAD